jgi:hypothetical protein
MSIIFRLRKRAEIRKGIITRKSVQEGKADRISELLEEAANTIEQLESELAHVRAEQSAKIAMLVEVLEKTKAYLIPRVAHTGHVGRTEILPAINAVLTATSADAAAYEASIREDAKLELLNEMIASLGFEGDWYGKNDLIALIKRVKGD